MHRLVLLLFGAVIMLLPGAREPVLFMGIRRAEPTPLHDAIVYMVGWCLGRDASVYRLDGWATAEQIILVESRVPVYGVTIMNEDSTALIVIERDAWLHPGVISHELIHLFTGDTLDDRASPTWRCEMQLPLGLPGRAPLSPDSLATLLERAA